MQKTYCIIGTSAAGIAAAQKMRQLDSIARIICFTKEQVFSYNKCLLADYLSNQIEYPTFKSDSFFETNRIEIKTETEIISIDKKNKCITSSKGDQYAYDALLIATGGDIVRPELETEYCENVFDFYTYAQTENLKNYAQRNDVKTIVIVGAGLSGLECADALSYLNKKIIMIERASHVLSHQVTLEASLYIEKLLHKSNIELHTDTTVIAFRKDNKKIVNITLSNARHIDADLVIYALGARVNNQLLHQAQLEMENGAAKVNLYFQTSDSCIWAAGDICSVYNIFTQTWMKSCTWPEAMSQGMCAASNMAGIPKEYKGVAPIISSAFFGHKFFVAGRINPSVDDVVISLQSEGYGAIVLNNNKVQGFTIIGDNKEYFLLKQALLTQTEWQK